MFSNMNKEKVENLLNFNFTFKLFYFILLKAQLLCIHVSAYVILRHLSIYNHLLKTLHTE